MNYEFKFKSYFIKGGGAYITNTADQQGAIVHTTVRPLQGGEIT